MSVASNGTEKEDQTQLETDTNSLDQTYELWQHLAREEKKSLPCPNVMTKRQRKKFTKTLLRGFASGSKPNFRVSNLFSYEKRFVSWQKAMKIGNQNDYLKPQLQINKQKVK